MSGMDLVDQEWTDAASLLNSVGDDSVDYYAEAFIDDMGCKIILGTKDWPSTIPTKGQPYQTQGR